jgi:Conserved TM helix
MWNEVGQSLSRSMTKMLDQLANLLPGVIALIAALAISALIAWAVSTVLRRSLTGLDFDRRVTHWGFTALREWSPSSSPTLLVSRAIGWIIVGVSAFDGALPSQLVVGVFAYLPNLIAAAVVLIAGSVIARFLARSVLIGGVNMHLQYARLLSVGVKWLVTVLAVTIAIERLGIGGGIIRLAFGILFGGIVLALALAVGLGSKELVTRSLEREAIKASSSNDKEPVGHL